MRIGLLGARADSGGLGVLTQEFYNHIKPSKTMVVDISHMVPSKGYGTDFFKYPDGFVVSGAPSNKVVSQFCEELDLVFGVENPYNPDSFLIARGQGVKSVLQPMYEWHQEYYPDHLFLPTNWEQEKYKGFWGEVEVMYAPVNRDKIPFRKRKEANVFLHVAGHGGRNYDRNGTKIVLEALKYSKADFKLLVYAQHDMEKLDDPRVEYRGEADNYYEMYDAADVFLFPRRYAGLSLPLNEALSAGMAIIMTDMKPQNEYLPKELLVKTDGMGKITIKQEINIGTIRPKPLAKVIDSIAGKNIEGLSEQSNEFAERISWKMMLPKYMEAFERICNE